MIKAVASLLGAFMMVAVAVPDAQADVTGFNSGNCAVPTGRTHPAQEPWHLKRLNMEAAWHIATGRGVKIAVIDTGAKIDGSLYLGDGEGGKERFTTYDALNGLGNDKDRGPGQFDCLHGTRVLALLAAAGGGKGSYLDDVQFSGIAPEATVIAYRSLTVSDYNSKEGKTAGENKGDPLWATTAAVRDAIKQRVDIINLSQVVSQNSAGFGEFAAAIHSAISQGIVVVAAAGNQSQALSGSKKFPASFKDVISVGATTKSDTASRTSQVGSKVDIGAPGEDIVSLDPSNSKRDIKAQRYSAQISGTSYATPIVSGVIALMIEKQKRENLPKLSPSEIRKLLMATADPPGEAIPDQRIGAGIINPVRFLSGEDPVASPNSHAPMSEPVVTYPPERKVDMRPAYIGLVVGAVALTITGLGIVAAIAIPAARRNVASKK